MDRVMNPYAPGAGTTPPELAGRDELLESVRLTLERVRRGMATKSVVMVGLRGVGKTVLLDRLRDEAEAAGIQTLRIEGQEGRSLPALLAPELRQSLLRLSRNAKAKELSQRALRALAGFARSLKPKFPDIEVGIDFDPEPGLADNGDPETDLQAALEAAGDAAREGGSALAIFVDELQSVREAELAALISALHRTAQRRSPVVLVGAGLPQLLGQMGHAKSYAERLFDFPELGPLTREAVMLAILKPARDQGVDVTPKALERIVTETRCHPYFVQEWGKHAWDVADGSPITGAHVREASVSAIAALDESYFRARFDRRTPAEKRYLRAMAELGPGPHRSGEIARVLRRGVTSLAPTRGKLIRKGMIWSRHHGETAFTVPSFDEFMRRIMPGEDWRA